MKNIHRFILLIISASAIILSAFILPVKKDKDFTGYAIASITEHSIETKSVGFADKENAVKYDTLTIQPVGSVSKTLIGLSLMIAKEQGFIDLDEDINKYLDFEISNPHIEGSNIISLRHLATHTSGIKDHHKFYRKAYLFGNKPKISLEDYLKQYLIEGGSMYSTKNFSKYATGTYYSYSNIAAALAAYVLEQAVGMPFNEFTHQYITKPLGMTQSGWFYKDMYKSKYAILYDKKDAPLESYSLATYPDGGFKTSIHDLSIYLKELIKGYNHNSPLLSNDSWDEFFRKNFTKENPVQNIHSGEPNSGIFMAYSKSGMIGHTVLTQESQQSCGLTLIQMMGGYLWPMKTLQRIMLRSLSQYGKV